MDIGKKGNVFRERVNENDFAKEYEDRVVNFQHRRDKSKVKSLKSD